MEFLTIFSVLSEAILNSNILPPSPVCTESSTPINVQNYLVATHNYHRMKVSNGSFKFLNKFPMPASKNMYKLAWNCELEKEAQALVDQCNPNKFENSDKDNIYSVKNSQNSSQEYLAYEAMEHWLRSPCVKSNCLFTASTTEMGCALKTCANTDAISHTVICKYWPMAPENAKNIKIYESGVPCQTDEECTTYENSTCDTWTGLCEAHIQHEFLSTLQDIDSTTVEPDETEKALFPEEKIKESQTKSECDPSSITVQQRNTILQTLNKFRSKLAKGGVLKFDGSKGVKNMYKQRWNCELEKMAEIEAKSCWFNNTYYENIGKTERKFRASLITEDTLNSLINNWWNLDSDLNKGVSFAQMSQAESTNVGCAINFCDEHVDENEYKLVCLYWPRREKKIFKLGEHCHVAEDCTTYHNSVCNESEGLCVAPPIY